MLKWTTSHLILSLLAPILCNGHFEPLLGRRVPLRLEVFNSPAKFSITKLRPWIFTLFLSEKHTISIVESLCRDVCFVLCQGWRGKIQTLFLIQTRYCESRSTNQRARRFDRLPEWTNEGGPHAKHNRIVTKGSTPQESVSTIKFLFY